MTDEHKHPSTPMAKPEHPGSERERDAQRNDAGPQYGGEPWDAADRRGDDERFGHARNDAADPLQASATKPPKEPDETADEADDEEEDGEQEDGEILNSDDAAPTAEPDRGGERARMDAEGGARTDDA
jgi:hypothetical protein